MRRRRSGEQHIGSAHGLIAIWCDETEAIDLAESLGYGDRMYDEIMQAVERAYPQRCECGADLVRTSSGRKICGGSCEN